MAGKTKIVDEIWDNDRIQSFLEYQPCPGDGDPNFHIMYRAYKYMRPDDFKRFLKFFLAQDGELQACDARGRTLVDIIKDHHRAAAFIEHIKAAVDDSTTHSLEVGVNVGEASAT